MLHPKKLAALGAVLLLAGVGCGAKQSTDSVSVDTVTISTPTPAAKIITPVAPRAAVGPTSLKIADQTMTNDVITITNATFAEDSWVVIQTDKDGQPDEIISKATYDKDKYGTLRILVDPNRVTPILHATIYADGGSKGEFEPGSDDPALTVKGKLVRASIKVTVTEAAKKAFAPTKKIEIIATSTIK